MNKNKAGKNGIKKVYILDEATASPGNGVGRYINSLLPCLYHERIHLTLIMFNADVKEFTSETDGPNTKLSIPVLHSVFFMHYPSVISYLFRMHIHDSPDNVFILNHSPCTGLLKMLRSYYPLSKLVFVVHDLKWAKLLLGDSKELKKRLDQADGTSGNDELIELFQAEKDMLAVPDAVVCLCRDTFHLLKKTYSLKNKIVLIPNGLADEPDTTTKSLRNPAEEKKKMNLSPAENVLLFVGRICRQKGATALIEAFGSIIKKHPDTRLVLAGSIFEKNIMQRIPQELLPKITFTGQISYNDLKKWYSVADIGIISSYNEQCSYAGIEMMMYGLPVIASDGYGVRNMFRHRNNALVARIGNRKTEKSYAGRLAAALSELLALPALKNELSRNARKCYEQKYSLPAMKEKYRHLLFRI